MKNPAVGLKTNFKYLIEDLLVFERYKGLIDFQMSFWLYKKKIIKIKKRKPQCLPDDALIEKKQINQKKKFE